MQQQGLRIEEFLLCIDHLAPLKANSSFFAADRQAVFRQSKDERHDG